MSHQKSWKVPSKSRVGKLHTVTKMSWRHTCTCERYTKRRGECNHIRDVKDDRVNYAPAFKPMVDNIKVGEVMEKPQCILVPYILLDKRYIHFYFTVLYDLLCLGVSWGALCRRLEVPRAWTKYETIKSIENWGRLVNSNGERRPNKGYMHRPVNTPFADSGERKVRIESVNMWEWICPDCEIRNTDSSFTKEVICRNCHYLFEAVS